MPMSNLMAVRLGRPDLASGAQGSISVDFASAAAMGAAIGPSNGGGITLTNDVTVGRAGLAFLIIVVGAMAISYVSTRRLQY